MKDALYLVEYCGVSSLAVLDIFSVNLYMLILLHLFMSFCITHEQKGFFFQGLRDKNILDWNSSRPRLIDYVV